MLINTAYLKEAKNNARIISWALSDLASMKVDSYKKFTLYREKSEKIVELFKHSKPLLMEDRKELYERLEDIAYKIRREHEERKKKIIIASQHEKEHVLLMIQDAKGYIYNDLEGLKKAEEILALAYERMNSSGQDNSVDPVSPDWVTGSKMIKEDWRECRTLWLDVKKSVYIKRSGILNDNYREINLAVTLISELAEKGSPYEALKQIQAARIKVVAQPMSSRNTDSVLISLQKYWDLSVNRIKEIKDEEARKLITNERNIAERREMIAKLDKLKAERFQKEKEKRIAECQELIAKLDRQKAECDQKQQKKKIKEGKELIEKLNRLNAERNQKSKNRAALKAQHKAELAEHKKRMKKELKILNERQQKEHLQLEKEKDKPNRWNLENSKIIKAFENETKKLKKEIKQTKLKRNLKQMGKKGPISINMHRGKRAWRKV